MSSPGCYWRVPGRPERGFDELIFPLALHEYPVEKQWFAAFQWNFVGPESRTAYTGLQPAPNGMVDLRFSVFGTGTRAVDIDRCSGGADGGSGVTCDGTSIPLHRSRTYDLRVYRDAPGSRIWCGEVIDTVTGQTWPTGAWEIPGDGGLPGWGMAWMEHYKSCACDRLPMLSLHAGPVRHDPSNTVGYCYDPEDGGGCAGRNNYAAEAKQDGRVWMRNGWPGVSCSDRRVIPVEKRTCQGENVTVEIDVVVNGQRKAGA